MDENGSVPLCTEGNEERNKWKWKDNKRKIVKIASFVLFTALVVFAFYMQHYKMFVVLEGNEKKQYYTFTETVGDFLDEKGLKAGDYDQVVPGRDEPIQSGDTISIKKAIPVTLIVDRDVRETFSTAVEDLLKENSLELTEEDTVSPALNHILSPGDQIKVARVIKEIEREKVFIPYSTVRVYNPYLDRGIVKAIEEGSEGIKEIVNEIVKRDGLEISRTAVSTEVVEQPVNRVLEYGENTFFSRGDRNYIFETVLYVSATAYCAGTPGSGCPVDHRGASHCTGLNNDGYTYTGIKAVAGDGSLTYPHILAVDPSVIPLKTLVYIDGYGFARAEDTGSAIKENSIDLLFDQHHDAYMFGRKQLKVYILTE
ncbi:MAG: G5 domain-containing protein [Bacillota bacterium]|nr:G5 domain-containing protein [Bacillota bacterium]